MKKVAILLATYNGEKFLEEQLNSLLNQTYKNFDIIIRDDKSKDKTYKIIKKYKKIHPDKIIDITDGKSSGNPQNNFLILLEYAYKTKKYEFYMFCDQDDYWLRNKVLITIKELKKEKEPCLAFTDLNVVDENKKMINPSFLSYCNLPKRELSFNELIIENNAAGCTIGFNNELAKHVIFEQTMIMHDFYLAKIASLFGKIIYIDKSTILYRQHNNNSLGATKFTIFKKLNCFKSFRNDIYYNVEASKQFYNLYKDKLDKNNKEILVEFSNIRSKSKLKRIYILIKYKILKYGLLRIIVELLCI